MNFKIYILGEPLEKFYTDAIKEYDKRLSRYCKCKLVKIKNEDQLLKKLSPKSYKIIISPQGSQISSEELASKISTLGISGKSNISIIIGNNTLPCDENLSISPMEMTLGLATTIVFEQIYRSYRILNNQPYHK